MTGTSLNGLLTSKAEMRVSDNLTTSGLIISAITKGLTALPSTDLQPSTTVLPPSAGFGNYTSTVSPSTAESRNFTSTVLPSTLHATDDLSTLSDVLVTTLRTLVEITSQAVATTTERLRDTTAFVLSHEVTSQVSGVTSQMNSIMDTNGITTESSQPSVTEEPVFELSPMHKWFLATGIIICLVIILILINCCLSYKAQLEQTVKDVKHYAAEEKRVKREQRQIDAFDKHKKPNQTHVFWTWGSSNEGERKGKSPKNPKKQYTRV